MVPLTLACGNYDRTRAIMDGRVRIEGCEINYISLEPEEVFFRAARYQDFDVAELSFNSYILQTSRNESHYIGIPAFVSRCFRHSMIYVRTDRGIREPADLKGKLVGVPEYQLTALVWIRGILEEEYGVKPSDIHWRSGGQEQPGRKERAAIKLSKEIDLQPIPLDETLASMLLAGKLDAVMTARAPSCFLNGSPNIDRMFPNHREVEKAYYKKTGLYPIMHLVGIQENPGRALSVAAGECFKGVYTSQGCSYVRPADIGGAEPDAAVDRSRDARNHGADGQGLLALWRNGKSARDRNIGALFASAGIGRTDRIGRGDVRAVDVRGVEDLITDS